MTILFAGGEEGDLSKIGGCSVDTATTAARRSAFSRCALKIASTSITDSWQATFAAASTFWLTARAYLGDGYNTAFGRVITLLDGTTPRLFLMAVGNPSGQQLHSFPLGLYKVDASGSSTLLATAGVNLPTASLVKFDLSVTYGTSGNVKVYLDGTLIINYSGDVTTNSATSLSAVNLGLGMADVSAGISYWSEVIVATIDTRTLSLFTLPPAAAGNANTWTTGTYADANEVTLNDATVATSASVNQIFETTVASSGLAGAVVGVVVNARAQKGNTGGPANANLMVRTASTDYLSSSVALPTGALDKITGIWETNPNTGVAWTASDLTAAGFNIGIKSLT